MVVMRDVWRDIFFLFRQRDDNCEASMAMGRLLLKKIIQTTGDLLNILFKTLLEIEICELTLQK